MVQVDAHKTDLDAHLAASTSVHGITNTALLLSSSTAAGGVLSGTLPNPGFAVDMATQAELDALAASGVGGYLAAHLVRYVDYVSGSDSNSGLSTALPMKTIQHAYDVLEAAAEATYTPINGRLPVGTINLLPGDHNVGLGVNIFGTRPVDVFGLSSGSGMPLSPNSCARIVTTNAAATAMFVISDTVVGGGCEFRNLGFVVNPSTNTGLVGSARGLIFTNQVDYLHVNGCHVATSDGSHISTPFIHQQGTIVNPDSAWARIFDNRVSGLCLSRFSATGTNYNRITIRDNVCFFDGGASNLAMIHAEKDFSQCLVQGNNFEGNARAVLLGGGGGNGCDFNMFIANSGECTDVTQPFYDITGGSQNNMFIGGACIVTGTPTPSNGTWIQFDATSHANFVVGPFDPTGFNGFKLKYLDSSTLGNTLIAPGNGEVFKYKSGAGVTTASDADFPQNITDGAHTVIRNTSDGTAKLAVRVNGAWKYVALT